MRYLRLLGGACETLLTHRTRTTLAISAIALGVALMFLVNAVGAGASAELLRGVEDTGTRMLVVRPASVKALVARRGMKGSVTSLRLDDCIGLAELDSIAMVAPLVDGQLKVRSTGVLTGTKVVGTSPGLLQVKGYALASGRMFDATDERRAARVAVLGHVVAQKLFPDADPVGNVVRIRGVAFDVAGVMQARGASADGSEHDNQILIPAQTALRRVYDVRALSLIYVKVKQGFALTVASDEIQRVLRRSHRLAEGVPDDFTIQNQPRWLTMRARIADTLGSVKDAMTAVAIVIGLAGVTALMLLSIKERISEIGLRLAVGARPIDIGLQFLIEAWLLSMSGGILGLFVAVLGAYSLARWTGWDLALSLESIAIPLGLTCVSGLIAGVLPARKAAKVPPMQALVEE